MDLKNKKNILNKIGIVLPAMVLSLFLGASAMQAEDNKYPPATNSNSSKNQLSSDKKQSQPVASVTYNKKPLYPPHPNGAPRGFGYTPLKSPAEFDSQSK